jgi:hypothetical protein
MKRVYIAGPISQGELWKNVNQATEAFIQLAKAGLAPFCPQWSVYAKKCGNANWGNADRTICYGTRNGNDEMTHEEWIRLDLAWVSVSDAVLRLPGASTGADREVDHAVRLGIPVFYTIEVLVAWSKS